MTRTEKFAVAAIVLVAVAYVWGLANGSLIRGTFTHQQIVAFFTGVLVAVAIRTLMKKNK